MLPKPYGRILVPLDGSEVAERVLAHAGPIAAKLGSTLLLLRVTLPADFVLAMTAGVPGAIMGGIGSMIDPTPIVESERQEAFSYLNRLGRQLRQNGLIVECICEEGAPAQVIVAVARYLQADLIAMASHGPSTLERLFTGNVADDVKRNAPCPVIEVYIDGAEKSHPQRRAAHYVSRRSWRWIPQESGVS